MPSDQGRAGDVARRHRCDGTKQIDGNVRECVLPLGHDGDCKDERGWFGMPERLRKKADA